jgi:tetratricopeptide (TPR) repeat protein
MTPILLTGVAAKIADRLGGAAAGKAKGFWLRDHEGARLVSQLQHLVKADAAVHHEVRDALARALPDRLRTDPAAQGALVLLLAGEDVEAACAALAQTVARLAQDAVVWPADFTAARFGEIVAGHALDAVTAVKASDRDAAHIDAKHTHQQLAALPAELADAVSAKLPLSPPFSPDAGVTEALDTVSLLEMLRASERRFPLVGREQIMRDAERWLRTPPPDQADHRVMIIHGPGGAGKTRLAGEILTLAEDDGWVAGFLSTPESGAVVWPELSHPTRPLAIAIDYSEARRADLQQLFHDAPVGHRGSAPLRVILLVREGKTRTESWATRLGGPVDLGQRGNRLLAEENVEVVSLAASLPEVEDRRRLWCAARDALGGVAESPAYLTDSPFERPLYLLLDAHRHSTERPTDRSQSLAAPTVQHLLDGVLRHERNYWVQARRELELELTEDRMNQVAVVATLVGGASRSAFETALEGLAWLAADAELRRRVVDWWGAVYATDTGAVRGVEPDIVGEYQVIRALGSPVGPRDQLGGLMSAVQLTALVATTTLSTRQRILRVLTRIATSEDSPGAAVARATLGEVLSRHLDEFLPGTFDVVQDGAETGGAVGESLATTVASAAVAANALSLIDPTSSRSGMREQGPGEGGEDVERDVALQLIRRQVERIAEQQYEAGHWSSQRYLEIVQWAVELDLRSGQIDRATGRIADISELTPRPHRQLAVMLLSAGRWYQENKRHEEADDAYRRALDELDAAGEADTLLAYVIWHDRGSARAGIGDQPLARSHLERALAGKERLLEAGSPDAVTTLLELISVIAVGDLEEAFRRLDEAVESLADASAESVERVKRFRPSLPFRAARAAEADERWEAAERLYRRTLVELSALDEQDEYSRYVVLHDLGDVMAARGEHPAALEHFETALAGKARLRGLANRGTITTLLRLVDELAKSDVDKAIERLDNARRQLAEGTGHDSQLKLLNERELSLLANARRFEEATAAARRMQEAQTDLLVRRAILEAVGDPTVSDDVLTNVAAPAAVLAAGVFSGGDLRLAGLASHLVDAIGLTVGTLVSTRMTDSTFDLISSTKEGSWSLASFSQMEEALLKLGSAVPNYAEFAREGLGLIADAIERELDGPVISSLASPSTGIAAVADDRATRHWLARTVFASSGDDEARVHAIATLLRLYLSARLDVDSRTWLSAPSTVLWLTPESESIVEVEHARTVEDLVHSGEVDTVEARRLVSMAGAMSIADAGRRCEAEARWEDAERLYRRALEELEAVGQQDALLSYLVRHDLGDVALAQGQPDAALGHFEAALAGKTRILGLADRATLISLLRSAEVLAKTDLDKAIGRLSAARRQLGDEDHANHGAVLDECEIRLLANAGRSEEAAAAARRAQRDQADHDLRGALAAVLADPIADESTPTPMAADMCLLAADVFATDDQRLPALASRLAPVIASSYGLLAIPSTQRSAPDQLGSSDGARSPDAEARGAAPQLEGAPAEPASQVEAAIEGSDVSLSEVFELVKAAIGRAMNDSTDGPGVVPNHESHEVTGLADNRAVRRWLARTVFASASDEEARAVKAGAILTLYASSRLGLMQGPLAGAYGVIWSNAASEEAAANERPRLVEDLRDAGGLDAPTAERLVALATASALFAAAVERMRNAVEEAARLYARAQDALIAVAAQDTRVGYVIEHGLGDIALLHGDPELAVRRYERALAGKIRLTADRWDPDIVTTLLQLASVREQLEPGAARRQLEAAIAEASAAGATEQVDRMRRWLQSR